MRPQDWENRLRPYLSQIELLGEIPLEQAQHAELERALGEFVRQHGLTEATRRLRREYPAVFVTYLAFKAAFNDEHNFWDRVKQDLGMPQAQLHSEPHHWGRVFREIIGQYANLRQFRRVFGLEYVTPIRLHGGIPAFSLPDFFRHILLPSVEKAPYDGMEDAEALRALLNRYTAQLFVDDVVRHFFTHSGAAGQSFFSKCRHMARLALQGKLLAPAELGLRPYVIQRFETFQQEQNTPALRRRQPRLCFDPYQTIFRIVLPPQPLTLEQAGQRYTARLYSPADGRIYEETPRLRPRQQGHHWFVDDTELALGEPLEAIQVGLFALGAEQPIAAYAARLLPPAGLPPVLAFDYATTRQVSVFPSLPARALWLLCPADSELRFEGTARPLERLPPFAPPWQSWQATAWDLSGARLLRLLRAGQDICPPLAVARLLEPSLLPSSLPPHVLAVEEKPLYTTAPTLRLPLRNLQNPTEELTGWHVQMESRYAAQPQGAWQAEGAELPFQTGEGEARLPLAHWLGEAPAGTYHLKLTYRGRLVSELPFRVCAGLKIDGLQPYYLPADNGADPVTFSVHPPPGFRVLVDDDEDHVSLTPVRDRVKVTVAPHASQATLRMELPAEPEPVRVPLQVHLPRLRWALTLEAGAEFAWTPQPLTRPLAELLQTAPGRARPRLRVECPALSAAPMLAELHLTAPGRAQSLQASSSRAFGAGWLDFDLAGFFDTLRAHPEESIFEFALELLDAERDLNRRLTVLRLTRELDIRACHIEAVPPGGWRLHWHEPRPLRHRRLRLWSLWQPWADPIEIHLPDDAAPSAIKTEPGWWQFDIPSEEASLPPSRYCAHFVAVAPYETNPPPRFPPPGAIEIELVASQTRLLHIENILKNGQAANVFALHFERLCIYHTENRRSEALEVIKWCLAHWREANLFHLESLARWLGQYDPENQPAFLMHLFREESLTRLTQENYPPSFIQRYFENISRARTIQPASARLVLQRARQPLVILHALKALLKHDAAESRQFFWDYLEQGRFSEADAAALLKEYPDFARHLFDNSPSLPVRQRLLLALGRHISLPEYLVYQGNYILCAAGWGKVLEIHGAQNEAFFLPAEEKPTLVVELLHWPDETIEVETAHHTITLLKRNSVYQCFCQRFIGLFNNQMKPLWNNHRLFCQQTKTITQGKSFQGLSPIIYRTVMPENPLDTTAKP